jgi:hypothetical protein
MYLRSDYKQKSMNQINIEKKSVQCPYRRWFSDTLILIEGRHKNFFIFLLHFGKERFILTISTQFKRVLIFWFIQPTL